MNETDNFAQTVVKKNENTACFVCGIVFFFTASEYQMKIIYPADLEFEAWSHKLLEIEQVNDDCSSVSSGFFSSFCKSFKLITDLLFASKNIFVLSKLTSR